MTNRPIRVLLIDGHMEDSRWVQELLADFESCRFGAGWMQGLELFHMERLNDALTLIGDSGAPEQFDAVLLNPSLRDSFGLHSFLRLQQQAPEIPVVVLADEDDPDLAISMVRAGAQDYLAKMYIEGPQLARSLRLAVERNRISRHLRAESFRDSLTGLPNRTGFQTICEYLLAVAGRLNASVAVVLVALDNLPAIGASYGRSEQHLALVEAADWVRDAGGSHAVLAYLDDSRFAIAFTGEDNASVQDRIAALDRRFQTWRRKANRRPIEVRFGSAWYHPGRNGSRDTTTARLTVTDLLASAAQALWDNEDGSGVAGGSPRVNPHLAHSARRDL